MVGLTNWLTRASSRQATQTAELIRMSRMAGLGAARKCADSAYPRLLGSVAMGAKRQIWWWASAAGGLVAGLALPPAGLPQLLWLALGPLWGMTAAPISPW